ncbi:protein kinase [Ornithinimicrobium faecis]|uniref:non-specific serine/threonine protein kinase n=1 Tax=Ornithinimicrobium faecis TaxID=2934158 RepID=A0ABY4YR08_9MICO|nr:protein kinase [Ornithinimicrobium sp. HY1793]USQ79196.1 protein kinase [Ornithinimicrobium sp. HY1793]
MADLRVKGDYVGPGEQKTAEYLASTLPDDWVIFAGRKLPGPNRDDADLVVVGENLVFVVEEKAWGPTVVVDDNHWYVRDDPRPNPLNRVAQVARIVATTLKQNAKGYRNLGRAHRVVPAVVLSHSKLQVLMGPNHDERERIWSLEEAARSLVTLDREFAGAPLGRARRPVITYLDDLPKPGGKPTIGSYTLEARLASAGQEQSWSALDSAGERVVLKCYPMAALGVQGDPEEFLQREYVAVNRVADLGRTWRAYPPIKDDASGLFVVPVVPPRGGMTLHQSVQKSVPERVDGQLDAELARAVAMDAFNALHDLHEAGLVHRALHPKRIWLHQKRRVMFSDLNLARVVGDESIALWAVDGDMSEDFRSPESAPSISLASKKSDVYSLAMCLAYWLLGRDVLDLTHDQLRQAVAKVHPWAEPILKALSGDAKERPGADDLAEQLRPVRVETPAVTTALGVFEEGGLIGDRYEIVEELGRGGFATSWKVYDRQRELSLVLKQFHADLPENVRAEFRSAHNLHSDYLGGVYDLHVNEAPLYIVSEHVEGESLGEEGQAFTIEQLRAIASDVLSGLDYIHGRDLVHGDVTPSNVIVAPDGNSAKLIDFGLMVRSGEQPSGQTPKFAAPELLKGAPATVASDLFGFSAAMAYAMLGRPISSTASGSFELLPPTQDEQFAWGLGGEHLLETFLRGAKGDPAERPRSAKDFLNLLRSTQLAPSPADASEDGDFLVNLNVGAIRRLYRASADGNAGNRGLDDDFALATYVPTRLDDRLIPRVLAGELDVVLLSGNPGDGKTSLLVQLGQMLKNQGASTLHEDDAGWVLELNGRNFHAVFDASEAHGELTSDELVKQALEPVMSGKEGPATALIAINDGRLHQFFEDNSDAYEDWWFEIQDQLSGGDAAESRVVLVDLKRRALASGVGKGLADTALASLVRAELWSDCSSCAARALCPILSNRDSLKGEGAAAFSELMLISHLRRRRRATFRDVRSAAAWLITGDRNCPDVHELVKTGKDPRLMADALTHDLAFVTDSNDYLVDEWSDLDPALVPSPVVDRIRRLSTGSEGGAFFRSGESAARAIYFGDHAYQGVGRDNVRVYRHLDEFLTMLTDTDPAGTRNRLLLGMSRLLGAPGYAQPGLAFNMGAQDSRWAVLHAIEPESFTVQVADSTHRYVETIPDLLELQHVGGSVRHTLRLNLDTAEMILRAADGELVDDAASDAIRQEIDAFVGQLSMQPSKAAHIVDSSGSVSTATISGVDIAFHIEGGVDA